MKYKYLILMLTLAISCNKKPNNLPKVDREQPNGLDLRAPQQIPIFKASEIKCKKAALKIPRKFLLSKTEDLSSEENINLPEEVDFFTKSELGEFKFTFDGDFDKITEAKVTLNGKDINVKISDDGKSFSAIIDKTGRAEASVTKIIKGAELRMVKTAPKVFFVSAVDRDMIAKRVGNSAKQEKTPENAILECFRMCFSLYVVDNKLDDTKEKLIKIFSAIKENDNVLLDLYSIFELFKKVKIKIENIKSESKDMQELLPYLTTFDYFKNGDPQKLINYLYFTAEKIFEVNNEIAGNYLKLNLKFFHLYFYDLKIYNIERTIEFFNKLGLKKSSQSFSDLELPKIWDEGYNFLNGPSIKEVLNFHRLYAKKFETRHNLGQYICELNEDSEKLIDIMIEEYIHTHNDDAIYKEIFFFIQAAIKRMALDYKEGYIEGESWLKIIQQYFDVVNKKKNAEIKKLENLAPDVKEWLMDEILEILEFVCMEKNFKRSVIPFLKIVDKLLEKRILTADLGSVWKFISVLFDGIKHDEEIKVQFKDLITKILSNKSISDEAKKILSIESTYEAFEFDEELDLYIKNAGVKN